jgi:hypothetical protein
VEEMIKFKKVSFMLIISSLLVITSFIPVNASEHNAETDSLDFNVEIQSESHPILQNFLDDAFQLDYDKISDFIILNELGQNVQDTHLDSIKSMYASNDLDGLYNYIKENNLKLVIEERTRPILKNSSNTQFFSQIFYGIGNSYGYRKDWTVQLSGSVSYNMRTKRITSASTPTITLQSASWGALWSPYISNVSTGRSISSSKVYFWGAYTMMGSLALHTYMPTLQYNFGSYSEGFYAYPSF